MAEVIVPAVTVFDHNGKPDPEDNRRVIEDLLSYGIDGILILDFTGEFTELSI